MKCLNEDSILPNLSKIQRYLNILELKGEITKDEHIQIGLRFAWTGRPHGPPKIRKQFVKIPSFQPITDTIIRPH